MSPANDLRQSNPAETGRERARAAADALRGPHPLVVAAQVARVLAALDLERPGVRRS